ncbi:reverse transcriptase [Caerostris extrusa]|uniref:Reverse transcriptase n=1 Tax=Caerostris extrusa TaxID=172846 RepID=A0AAV4UGC5_CAEEX|nr:reverse transcriptase [Caerostris extrusa]
MDYSDGVSTLMWCGENKQDDYNRHILDISDDELIPPPGRDEIESAINKSPGGHLINQGILYVYAPDSDTEKAQLVMPSQERKSILKLHQDSPMAGHHGEEGIYQRIAQRYYSTGLRSYIANYVKDIISSASEPSRKKEELRLAILTSFVTISDSELNGSDSYVQVELPPELSRVTDRPFAQACCALSSKKKF